MGKFFQSELVRGTIQEMTVLQEFCFKSAMNLPLLKKEQQLEYFDALIQLIEKQKIFYTRVRLSDDPDAESIKENMKQAALLLGGDPNMNVIEMFDDLLKKVTSYRNHVEKLDKGS
tara:strand:+ start:2070 stop:2417 length:348 start_codon:yes stop_codon:yes gene_type:complete